MKKLKDLINTELDIDILGVESDTRNIKEGFLFVATKGYFCDHLDYLDDAINKGAVCVIADREVDSSIPLILVDDLDDTLNIVLSKFYDINLSDFNFIGITGTDGKTTTTSIISGLINQYKKCAYIGTNGLLIGDELFPTSNTTPCIEELYKYMVLIRDRGVKDIVIEVSSEALLHGRVDNILFTSVGFTNITGDHLNIHGTMDNYISSKFKLCDLVSGNIYINKDDNNLNKKVGNNVVTYGFSEDSDYVISDFREADNNSYFSIKYIDNIYNISSPFVGKYNAYNLCLAFAILNDLGYESETLVENIKLLGVVAGRRELLDFGTDFDIIVDYAHTTNGTLNIMDSVVGKYNKIYTIVGSAGGREKEKRNDIGNIVLNNSDMVIFTMDDPRYEDVNIIIDEMIGEYDGDNYIRIIDRVDAINYALSNADSGDVVLILGKGNDNYMAIEDKRLPYNDINVVKEYFEKK